MRSHLGKAAPAAAASSAAKEVLTVPLDVLSLSDYASVLLFSWRFVWGVV
jgi:hypothetical protein